METAAESFDDGQQLATLEPEASTVALLNRSEIDQQVRTAKQYPRSIKGFRDEVLALSTLNELAAEECTYALQRKNADGTKKTIVGPSARFAEIVLSAWTNCRAGARVIEDKGDYVTAQGAFMDLQKNVAITYEVQRRVTDKNGRRYSPDMVGVTANAACSIALRNAVLKGVPRAMWKDLWDKSREVAVGDVTTLTNRRAKIIERFVKYGIDEQQILAKLGRPSVADITLDDIEVLIGMGTAIKDGEITPEEAFAVKEPTEAQTGVVADLNQRIQEAAKSEKAKPAKSPPAAGEAVAAGEAQGKQAATATAASVPGVTKTDILTAIDKIVTATDRELTLDLMRGLSVADQEECVAILKKKDAELAAKRK
jgi:hypothetical protein